MVSDGNVREGGGTGVGEGRREGLACDVPVGKVARITVEVKEGSGGRGARLGNEPGVDSNAVCGDDVGVCIAHRIVVGLFFVTARG